jgi:hypothetical protein
MIAPFLALSQEGMFLKEEEAPRAVFPDATSVERKVIPSSDDLKSKIAQRMGKTKTSLWEDSYVTFRAKKGETVLGYAVIVEEIGKHRPITYAVAVEPNATVHDLAVLAYREPYGGEIRERRFLRQYTGKGLAAPLLPYRDIVNISGATLSVEATGRAAKKAIAVLRATGDLA